MNINIKKSGAAALAAALLFCGCAKNGNNEDNSYSSGGKSHDNAVTAEVYRELEGDLPSYFEYKYTSNTNEHFAVAPDGRLIITLMDINTMKCRFIEYQTDGTSRELCSYDSYPDSIAFMGDDLYVSGTWDKETRVSRLDLETGKTEPYAVLPIKYGIGTMSGNADELYILGDDPEKQGLVCDYPFFSGAGQGKSVYRISGGEAERLPVDFPSAVCAKQSGGAIIAACDGDGYHIVRYENGELGEKVYSSGGSGDISSLADVDGEHIICSTYTTANDFLLCAADTDSFYLAELFPDKHVFSTMISAGGYCFYGRSNYLADGETGTEKKERIIERIKFSDYFRYNPPLNFIRTGYTNATPYGCGYMINVSEPSSEETALKILSQDKDYDICYVNTRCYISYSLKKQGCFYPLTDIDGVKEYLDECFPSVKEAFTDENGDIWALPIRADSFCIMSNYGDNDYSRMTFSELVDFIDGLSDDDLAYTDYSAYTLTEHMLADYTAKHDSFDTPEFRAAAEKLKNSERLNNSHENSYHRAYIIRDENGNGRYDNENDDGKRILSMFYGSGNYIDKEGYTVYGAPGADESNVFAQEVCFLGVNPNSEHLQDALAYISELVKYQRTLKNNFIFKGEEYYSDTDTARSFIALSSDPRAKVRFTVSFDLFWDDFNKYLAGEISLDSFIKEADRKLRTYLNE